MAFRQPNTKLHSHREFLEQGYRTGKLLVSGPRVPRTGGVVVARVKSREEVEALIHDDPFHKEGIADYEVVEFQAMKFHASIADLV